ncbi:hypothetical protein Tco_0080236 [Tanacetum coccineum]
MQSLSHILIVPSLSSPSHVFASPIGFNSTIKLVSFDESQVATFNSEFVYDFRNGDCRTESQSDNTVGSPHGFIIHWIVIFKDIKKVTEIVDVKNQSINNFWLYSDISGNNLGNQIPYDLPPNLEIVNAEKSCLMQEEQSSLVPVSDSVEGKSVHDTKNAQKESSKLTSTQNDVNSNTEIEILGGEVSDVYILGSSNGNALIQGTADDHDQEGDGTGEPMSSYIAEADPKVTGEAIDITARVMFQGLNSPGHDISGNNLGNQIPYDLPPNLEFVNAEKSCLMQEEQSSLVPVSDSVEGKSVHDTKNAQKESSKLTSTQNDVNSNTEIEILVENKDDNQTKTDIELLDNGGEVSDVYILGSSNGNALIQGTADDHDQEGDGTGEPMSSYIAEADPKVTGEAIDITARDGNSWSSGLAPPPPPGQRQPNRNKSPSLGNSSDGCKKSGIGGAAIARICYQSADGHSKLRVTTVTRRWVETADVPWSNERPLENKELNAIIGAWFTLWRD